MLPLKSHCKLTFYILTRVLNEDYSTGSDFFACSQEAKVTQSRKTLTKILFFVFLEFTELSGKQKIKSAVVAIVNKKNFDYGVTDTNDQIKKV